ncbi:GIY-YIG nuclease family protein [Bacillus sp. UMB0728]|uniref:GIY-YIG nuclease family protein n=1 Tax=Bacillus sp. UMB0728 TaxID=2066052 RepID=UPI000C779B8D|nr:GIY-YIG nuclease family protein [Bacillus sp. UMB0728]PLR73513.1 excinuclease ABC subunit C [Bacillus sp. UMB0728]
MLKTLLEHYGLDTKAKIKIARHKDEKRGYDLPLLYKNGQFDIYQSYQEGPDFHNCKYLVSFLGIDKNQAVFIGVYEVLEIIEAKNNNVDMLPPLPEDFLFYSIYKPKRRFYYKLRRMKEFQELEDRLVIQWSGGAINWIQNFHGTPKEVVQLLPKGYVGHFPGYLDFFLSYEELKRMIEHRDAHSDWHKMLSAVSGVYVILDTGTGEQYIGSAYGKRGILGRFESYAKSPDGGNLKLLAHIQNDTDSVARFQYSLLETLPASMTLNEVITRETLYKRKLGTRAYGLNLN